jgi:hypothetical protein
MLLDDVTWGEARYPMYVNMALAVDHRRPDEVHDAGNSIHQSYYAHQYRNGGGWRNEREVQSATR